MQSHWLVLVAFSLLITMTHGAETNPGDVAAIKQAAQQATTLFFPRAEKRKKDFGFEPTEDLAKATLADPIQLHTLDVTTLDTNTMNVVPSLKPSALWLVPVQFNGEFRAMIEVTRGPDGNWTGSGFGMAPLARQWQNVLTCWPAAGTNQARLLVCPPAVGYFFTVPRATPPNLTSLALIPEQKLDPSKRPALSPAAQTTRSIQALARKAKEQSER